MNWLAIIVVTTQIHGTQYMETIPAASRADCEAQISHFVSDYNGLENKYFDEVPEYAKANYFSDCVDIGSIVRSGK